MELMKLDIDQLLEATSFISDDDFFYNIKKIEIDNLLDKTQDW